LSACAKITLGITEEVAEDAHKDMPNTPIDGPRHDDLNAPAVSIASYQGVSQVIARTIGLKRRFDQHPDRKLDDGHAIPRPSAGFCSKGIHDE
jgi:hypothetical protein